MSDLLTVEEAAEAHRQGWGLFHVYDLKQDRWLVKPIPHEFKAPVPHVGAMTTVLLERARTADMLAIKALRLIAAAHYPAKGKKK